LGSRAEGLSHDAEIAFIIRYDERAGAGLLLQLVALLYLSVEWDTVLQDGERTRDQPRISADFLFTVGQILTPVK
jgi:hypothetical protein